MNVIDPITLRSSYEAVIIKLVVGSSTTIRNFSKLTVISYFL